MSIPIANVYYLLLYAWKHAQQRSSVDVGALPQTSLMDLLAHVLAHEAGRLIARGLARDYVTVGAAISGIRGKLDLPTTAKLNLLPSARTYCEFDELQYDIPRNRVLKGTLRLLLRLHDLDRAVRKRVRSVYAKLDGVSDVPLTVRSFATLQAHRHVRDYGFALQLCRLVFDSVIIDEAGSSARFVDFREDEARMARLFEDFVFEFYRREATLWTTERPQIRWHDAEGTPHDLACLPIMQTDVVLTSQERTVILDAKFYQQALRARFGHERVRSSHLYQIFAYLENRTAAMPGRLHEGILLYPVVETPFALTYRLKGHAVKVRSVDLSQPWRRIEEEMLALLAA